jgi:hypothetical protein
MTPFYFLKNIHSDAAKKCKIAPFLHRFTAQNTIYLFLQIPEDGVGVTPTETC